MSFIASSSTSSRRVGRLHEQAWVNRFGIATWSIEARSVAASTVAFMAIFSYLSLSRLSHFGMQTFDIGIYDQAFWLVSRGKTPFITLRGMNMWAHHTNLIAYLYAPFYWLGAGVRFLLVSQIVVLGLGSLPIYRMAIRRGLPKKLGAAAAISYLFYAPIQWLTWHTYHPETLAITPILFAAWYLEQRRWWPYVVASILAICTREEAAIALGLISIRYMIANARNATQPATKSVTRLATRTAESRNFWRNRAVLIPLGGALVSFAWFATATKFIIPHFNNNDEPYYIQRFYGHWGSTFSEVFKSALTNPVDVARHLFSGQNLGYVALMLFCIGGLSLASPSWLILALPTLFWNGISGQENTRNIQYQYTIFVVPIVLLASLNGLARIHRSKSSSLKKGWFVVALSAILGTQLVASPSPIAMAVSQSPWAAVQNPDEIVQGIKLIGPRDRVSADGFYGTTIAHREVIYDFPNPFVPDQYGPDEQTLADPNSVDRIIVWTAYERTNKRNQAVLKFLIHGGYYKTELTNSRVIVAKRVKLIPEAAISKLRADNPFVDFGFASKSESTSKSKSK